MISKQSNKVTSLILYVKKTCAVLLFLFFTTVGFLCAQNKTTLEYQLKAAFLYNFSRFVNWPANAFSSANAPFVIGIIGNDPFGSYIEEMVDVEKVGEHPIIIQHYRDVKEVDCQILFINLKEPASVKEILSALKQREILTVSDADQFTKWGGGIRLFKENNKIKIQINMAAVKNSQLEVSSKLLRIAKIL